MITDIPLSRITESPSNPRKHFGDLSELAASIREKGVLVPVLVRPKGKDYELVYGHRRLRASREAHLSSIPCMVRELDDREVLEAQVVENAQRSDVHPLEEAAAFRALHEEHGYTVEDLALRLGKSKTYVYGRLRLCALAPVVREAFLADKLLPTVALAIARLPTQAQQEKALETLQLRYGSRPTLEHAQAVTEGLTLDLTTAPFDLAATALVPKVGACTSCPKRSDTQPELFRDFTGEARCLDLACFNAKRDAAWAKRAAAAKAKGLRVLSDEEAAKAFAYGGVLGSWSEWVDLDDVAQPGQKDGPTWREVLGNPAPVVARDHTGRERCLAPRPKDLDGVGPRGGTSDYAEERAEHEAARQLGQETMKIVKAKLAGAISEAMAAVDPRVLRLVAADMIEAIGLEDEALELAKELGADEDAAPEFLLARLEQVSAERLGRLVALTLIDRLWWGGAGEPSSSLTQACKDFGVDLKKAEAAAKRALQKRAQEKGVADA